MSLLERNGLAALAASNESYRVAGQSVPRVDGRENVTAAARYVAVSDAGTVIHPLPITAEKIPFALNEKARSGQDGSARVVSRDELRQEGTA